MSSTNLKHVALITLRCENSSKKPEFSGDNESFFVANYLIHGHTPKRVISAKISRWDPEPAPVSSTYFLNF